MSSPSPSSSSSSLSTALLQYCIALSLQCPISPTAFSVGSLILLPSSSPLFPILQDHFPVFQVASGNQKDVESGKTFEAEEKGLILSTGFSRELEGNTHAEANALTKLNSKFIELPDGFPNQSEIQAESWIYATMEPCSIRTSGGPSCSNAILKSGIKQVYIGVQEPSDFVACEGIRLLKEGGVEVIHVKGLEEECLKAARRGLE